MAAANWPITAEDLRKALGIREGLAFDTAEAGLFAAAATERIEDEVGPWDGRALARSFTGPASALVLPWRFASVQSITIDGAPVDLAEVVADGGAGIIRGRFTAGQIIATVIARSGPPTIIHMAAREVAKLWWQQSKNGGRADTGDGSVPMGADLPRKVEGWIAPYRMAGFA